MKWDTNAWLAKLPSTNYMIFVAMNLALIVTLRAVLSDMHIDLPGGHAIGFKPWDPPTDLLGFIALLAGVGTTQFGVKRTTDAEYVAAKGAAKAPVTKVDNADTVEVAGDAKIGTVTNATTQATPPADAPLVG